MTAEPFDPAYEGAPSGTTPPSTAQPARDSAEDGQAAAAKASAKQLDTPSHRRRPAWRSPLTRRILALNMLVLLIPVLGLLHLDQYRQSLIDSELKALQVQAETFALAIGSAAVVDTASGEQQLLEDATRQTVRLLVAGTTLRARIFDRSGRLTADSFVLMGPGGQVKVTELPPLETGNSLVRWIDDIYDKVIYGLPGDNGLPPYREPLSQSAQDYAEAMAALAGDADGRVRAGGEGRIVLSLAVPVQRYRQVLGALMLTKDGDSVERAVRDRRHDILLVFGIALAVTVLLSLYLARTIALPIRRLAEAADRVRGGSSGRQRRGRGQRSFITSLSRRHDEIGDLAQALQQMTDALNIRMQAIEGFAADVAHEIKNPLTSLRSAVETAARIEDPKQQKKLMSIIVDDVQRLDRLISDISDASRLDAELARADAEEVDVSSLLATLAEVYRSVGEEREIKIVCDAATQHPLRIQGLEGRLGQVFRNLLSNAISFSPSGGTITLRARRDSRPRAEGGDWIAISVSDEGPGLPQDKLDAIFDRFYSERPEGEKFGTHSGLGLSISKQIVDAHGGVIYAENRFETGQVSGARFTVRLPAV
ncbi:stimulus-sensing domain-containing protein [Algihabitans albus]|uniref:stimulus-sensing domain-containing protein n=1 Tax=Algihabitans albus TaxID=2164067 RepID=UPI000E5C86C4|nr:stimulus-sensing domain-containing protein [Algihabitans albus]